MIFLSLCGFSVILCDFFCVVSHVSVGFLLVLVIYDGLWGFMEFLCFCFPRKFPALCCFMERTHF